MKKETKKKLLKHKNVIIGSIIVVIILIGVLMNLSPSGGEITSFKQGVKKIESLDKKYDTSFREEQLNFSMISFEHIDPFLEELEMFEGELAAQETSDVVEATAMFVEARRLMLKSQKNWMLGAEIGPIGEVHDPDGFSCAEFPYINRAAGYYNASWSQGISALNKIDVLLTEHKDLPEVQELIGIDDTKIEFFGSPLYQAGNHFRRKVLSLEEFCGLDFRLTDEDLKIIEI